MKLKVLAVSLLATLAVLALGVGSASAYYYLSYGQAKHAVKEDAVEACNESNDCSGYGVGGCRRITQTRIDCTEGIFHESAYGELECNVPVHAGVGSGGYLKLTYGSANCFYLE